MEAGAVRSAPELSAFLRADVANEVDDDDERDKIVPDLLDLLALVTREEGEEEELGLYCAGGGEDAIRGRFLAFLGTGWREATLVPFIVIMVSTYLTMI